MSIASQPHPRPLGPSYEDRTARRSRRGAPAIKPRPRTIPPLMGQPNRPPVDLMGDSDLTFVDSLFGQRGAFD
jgi:hypothetical protein